jgi:hypothetical protein
MFNHTLLNKMFLKRFCLPSNSDVSLYENGIKKVTRCSCGNYNHVACIIKCKGGMQVSRILSYGVNHIRDSNKTSPSIHAEYDAIRKLRPIRRKRLENINILVIRVSEKNKLQSSKPCSICITTMLTLPPKLGYNIKNVYYSTNDGTIDRKPLTQLTNEEKHITRHYR